LGRFAPSHAILSQTMGIALEAVSQTHPNRVRLCDKIGDAFYPSSPAKSLCCMLAAVQTSCLQGRERHAGLTLSSREIAVGPMTNPTQIPLPGGNRPRKPSP